MSGPSGTLGKGENGPPPYLPSSTALPFLASPWRAVILPLRASRQRKVTTAAVQVPVAVPRASKAPTELVVR